MKFQERIFAEEKPCAKPLRGFKREFWNPGQAAFYPNSPLATGGFSFEVISFRTTTAFLCLPALTSSWFHGTPGLCRLCMGIPWHWGTWKPLAETLTNADALAPVGIAQSNTYIPVPVQFQPKDR